jgi:hypothetical protein
MNYMRASFLQKIEAAPKLSRLKEHFRAAQELEI